jgi:DNA transformation protein and related proteins
MTSASFTGFVGDQLAGLESLRLRRMFGGHGLYWGEHFFGLIFDDRLFFKTNATTRQAYVSRGMPMFQPNERQVLRNYLEVPADVVENQTQLIAWAREAAAIS